MIRLAYLSGWATFLGSLSYAARETPPVNTEVIIIALTGVIAVVSTLIGVINTVKNDAFKNSQVINGQLEKQLDRMEKQEESMRIGHAQRIQDLEDRIERMQKREESDRETRIKNEDYIRVLIRCLSDNNILPPQQGL